MKWNEEKLPRLVSDGGPMYRRIYDAFRSAILKKQLAVGQKVPSSRDLAASYGTARITVLQAYEQLIAEGYLEGRRGAGTFVAAALPERFLRSDRIGAGEGAAEVAARKERARRPAYSEPIPFLSGCPDFESFPRERWLKLYARYLRGSALSLNSYGHPLGYEPLREAIAAHLCTHRGLVCDSRQILILSGSQPGIDLVGRALASVGVTVAVENPSYRGTSESFRLNGASLVGVPVDQDGMDVDALRSLPVRPKVVVTTPSRQFPLGYTMPIARRLELLEWARVNGSWILEDDYDSEFRFRGTPVPAMQGMDRAGRTLYLGTFSKSMFPDLRIGYLVAPPSLFDDFAALWRVGGMNPPVSLQAAVSAFLREGDYQRHIRRMRVLYAKRCAFLAERVQERLGQWIELGPTDGGLHFVGFLRTGMNAEELSGKVASAGITLFPLSRYSNGPCSRDGFIFGYSSFSEERLSAGVETVRDLLASS